MVSRKQSPMTMTTMEVNKSKEPSKKCETSVFSQSPSRLKESTMSLLSAIGGRLFSKPQEQSIKLTDKSDTVSVHSSKSSKSNKSVKSVKSNKSKQEGQDQTDEKSRTGQKEKKTGVRKKQDSQLEMKYKLEREFRRFKSKYNNSLGSIVRNWMNLIYCILILRMNVVKLILQRIEESKMEDCELQQQIRFESKIIYGMIREAQNYSQERSLFLWNQLEKLIVSRAVIRSALEEVHDKELALKDWKGAAEKLEQVKREAERLKAETETISKMKTKTDEETKEKLAELQVAEETKDEEMKVLLQQISEMKRKEVKLRGKILLDMKSYKDLKRKKQNLMNIEKDLTQLKSQQVTMTKEYADKIQVLKTEIKEKERLINAEKDEKRKLKANLKGLGDQNLINIIRDEPAS